MPATVVLPCAHHTHSDHPRLACRCGDYPNQYPKSKEEEGKRKCGNPTLRRWACCFVDGVSATRRCQLRSSSARRSALLNCVIVKATRSTEALGTHINSQWHRRSKAISRASKIRKIIIFFEYFYKHDVKRPSEDPVASVGAQESFQRRSTATASSMLAKYLMNPLAAILSPRRCQSVHSIYFLTQTFLR